MTTERVCSVEGCDGKHYAKGLCGRHWRAEYRAAHGEEIAAQRREYRAVHREENAAKCREYYAAHRDQIKAYTDAHKKEKAAWYLTHKDEVSVKKREYRAAHREEKRARDSEYYAAHRDQIIDRARKYAAEHKVEKSVAARKHYAAHRKEISEYAKSRPEAVQAARARRRSRATATLSKADRDLSVLVRKGFRENREPCAYCGTEYVEGEFHVDHDLPIARGGTDHWWNLQHSCAPCNLRKHTMTGDEFRALLESQAA